MVGFDGNDRAGPAHIEAACGAGAGFDLGEAVFGEGALEGGVDFDGAALGTRAFGGAVGAAVYAYEEIMIALGHGWRVLAPLSQVKPKKAGMAY